MAKLYSFIALVGMMAVPAAFIMGWRYDSAAPAMNYLFNLIAFLVFMAIHVIMLLPSFKRLVYGSSQSSSAERRVYVMVSVVTWIILYVIHKPVPGPALPEIAWVQFLGICLVLLGILMFFEGVTFEFLNAFLGGPGIDLSHSADTVTPLMTEGSYASVRHPMYRGALTYTFASLLIHPQVCQLLFAVMVALGFILFIPFEEKALIRSRGDEYLTYMQAVRYRIIRGIW
jgi:protein-S-isoprenylcysteine O-methyltransferase Ste14